MEPIHQCPLSTKERSIRSGQVQCDDVNSYHCLGSAADGQLRELCTSPIWIEAGIVRLSLYFVLRMRSQIKFYKQSKLKPQKTIPR